MLDTFSTLVGQIASLLWGSPVTLIVLLGTGLYLTVRLRFVQVRGFRYALREVSGGPAGEGEVSGFRALSTALSATVGTGNIAGVATAITFGGPGALFWMWATAVVGMATKFAESTLALNFREFSPDGSAAGGPMYTLKNGLKQPLLAGAFATFAMIASFGIGNMVQANSVVDGIRFAWPRAGAHDLTIGITMATLVALVIIGGVKRIARVASILVPFMSVIYIGAGLIVLAAHAPELPGTFALVVKSAFSTEAATGAVAGEAIRWGIARGLFSNEAGLGSSAMAFAAMKADRPAQAGLVNMLGPFFDTLVVCSITGFVILVTGAWLDAPESAKGAALTAFAFAEVFGAAGTKVVALGLALFAFSTTVAWSYYGDRCARFLFGARAGLPYRCLYVVLIVVGATSQLTLVWNVADVMNILMAVPNVIALVLLAGVADRLRREYLAGVRE